MNGRLRFLVTESSIRTIRIFLTKVKDSAVFAATSKNEDTWYTTLVHYRCQIRFNSKFDANHSRGGGIDGDVYARPERRWQPQRAVSQLQR